MNKLLLLLPNEDIRQDVLELVEELCDTQTFLVTQFDEAINAILNHSFDLAIMDNDHLDLNVVDCLLAMEGLNRKVPIIVLDDKLASAKSALFAFRFGVVDYLTRPIDLQHLWMAIGNQLERTRAFIPKFMPPPVKVQKEKEEDTLGLRPTVLRLSHQQFKQLSTTLSDLQQVLDAELILLNDGFYNIIAAAGDLQAYKLMSLKGSASIERQVGDRLSSALSDQQFHAAYLEGDHSSVYVLDNHEIIPFTLITVCHNTVKVGMVWTSCRQAMEEIFEIISPIGQPEVKLG